MRVLVTRALPDQPAGAWRSAWKISEMELGGMFKGVPIRGTWTCGISVMLGLGLA
jgi:hypothetical protein